MTRRAPRGAAVLSLGALVLAAPAADAQISPGPLSAAHAGLEGSTHCLACHARETGVAPPKCLACHALLRERIASSRGLHARPEYRDCKTCHVEHHGAANDLVYWGRAGRPAFDHGLTGSALAGRHARLECRACHQPRFNRETARLTAEKARLETTYLGLSGACSACHEDAHRGQFGGRGCESCHDQNAWKPAARFDHARTAAPLTGRHAAVACDKCHKLAGGQGIGFRKFVGVASAECQACHRDTHAGRLGRDCKRCHSPAGWERVERVSFDHARTDFPLRGRHAAVACEKCHRPGRSVRMAHARCADCHADAHLGQLSRRADQGRCESCHDEKSFVPARFGLEEHAATAYPLAGSHRAVACDACHERLTREALGRVPGLRPTGGAAATRTARFRFASTRCTECHRDPHRGEFDRHVKRAGCEACHALSSWREVRFDHASTRFPLRDGHSRVACAACHVKAEAGAPKARSRFAGLPLTCEGCHRDPHAGQLAGAALLAGGPGREQGAPVAACDRCHTAQDWSPRGFDHERDSRYARDGAHLRLACAACHPPATKTGERFVVYKPLPLTCRGCHAPEAGAGRKVDR